MLSLHDESDLGDLPLLRCRQFEQTSELKKLKAEYGDMRHHFKEKTIMNDSNNKIIIFDTTLRDGEQSPASA